MINLLPSQELTFLKSQKNERLTIVLGGVVLIGLVFLILVLLSLKFYILQDVSSRQGTLDILNKNSQGTELGNFKTIIKKYNTNLLALDGFYKKEMYATDALDSALNLSRPNGLYFTNILADRSTDSTIKISLAGFSNTRDNLLLFKKNIEDAMTTAPQNASNFKIKNVYFPPETWIKPANVTFLITLEVSNK